MGIILISILNLYVWLLVILDVSCVQKVSYSTPNSDRILDMVGGVRRKSRLVLTTPMNPDLCLRPVPVVG